MMRYFGYNCGMMGYGWGWIMMIGILIIVVLGILILSKYLLNFRKEYSNYNESKSIEILNERYAHGEISDEEYKKKKADIKG
jgi:putative membrane protein